MGLVEGVESGANHVEGYGYEHAHHAIDQDATAGRLLVGGGEVALDDGLVGGVGDEVIGQTTDDDDPPAGLRPGVAPVEQAQLVVGQGNVDAAHHTALGVNSEVYHGKDGAEDQYQALHYIAPNHGFYTTHGAIDDGDQAHEHNTQVDVDACNGCEGQRGQVEHDGHAHNHEDAEERRGQQAGEEVETLLQYLIGTGDVELAEVGEVVFDDGEADE